MADTIKMVSVLLMISIMLYLGQVTTGGGGLFGDDLISSWVQKDSVTDKYTGNQSSGLSEATSKFGSDNPSTVESGGTVLFNFWDPLQIFWKTIVLVANVVFIIPGMLFFMPETQIPYIIKLGLILPIMIISIVILIWGIMGKR
jgi:hypothetical protein